MKVASYILIFVFLLAISTANAWSVELKISCGNKNETLVFGFNKSADDSFDEFDVIYPPPLPQQTFYACFVEPDEVRYYKEDYKSKNLSWTLYIKADENVRIEWDSIPHDLNIIIYIGNESIDMNNKSSILLEAGEHILDIKVINLTSTQVTKTPSDRPLITPGFEIILALVSGALALFLKTLRR